MNLSEEELKNKVKKGNKKMKDLKGKYCVIRGDRSGVFAGIVQEQEGREVELTDCRRLWYWEGACSISEIATDGVTEPNECKFTVTVDEIKLLDVIEMIPCTEKAEKCIRGVKEWKKN